VLFPEKIGGRFALLHRSEAATHRHLPREAFNWRTWSRAPIKDAGEAPGVSMSRSRPASAGCREMSMFSVFMRQAP
jgi:hypothetical protein